ncbi:MAG: hypothetical protein A2583_02785 [Bdellovibrionales bacterium RIFOXYD1_FULL_53_11]|nr:MAG: hypothetical protein A2583_02785 [Bdellovibrionales bacterium RIFOXYD1_FULL_53_11]
MNANQYVAPIPFEDSAVFEEIERYKPGLIKELFDVSQTHPEIAELVVALWCERQELHLSLRSAALWNSSPPIIVSRLAIESMIAADEAGLALFYKLVKDGILPVSEVCAQLNHEGAVLWATGMIQCGLATIKGNYFLVAPAGSALGSRMMATVNGEQ